MVVRIVSEPDLAGIERELAVARERLAALRANRTGAANRLGETMTGGAPSVRSIGPTTERDGAARVRASAETGRLTAVEFVDPRVLRLSSDELTRLLVTTVNYALDSERTTSADEAGGLELDLIARQLREVQDEALGTLHRTMSALQGAVEQLRREANVTMPADIPDFQDLFAATEQSVAAARGGKSGPQDGDGVNLRGEGQSDARGYVRAVVTPAGRVESLGIDPSAMRKPSHELAGLVLTAVNSALEDLRARQRESHETAATERTERVRVVQDRSIADMRAFCDVMTRLMGSIRPHS
jgi:hypothetical protein